MQHTPNRGHNLDFFTKIHIHLLFTFSESYQRSYLTKINSNFISENVYSTHKTYRKFRIFGIGHSMECYESINKGCICTVPLLRE